MLTTVGSTLATARTAGSAAGSAWAKRDVASPKKIVARSRAGFGRGRNIGQQVTKSRSHCQLAAGGNGRRLNHANIYRSARKPRADRRELPALAKRSRIARSEL